MNKPLLLSIMLIVSMSACKKNDSAPPADFRSDGGTTSYPRTPVIQQSIKERILGKWRLSSTEKTFYYDWGTYYTSTVSVANGNYYDFKADNTVTIKKSTGVSTTVPYSFVDVTNIKINNVIYNFEMTSQFLGLTVYYKKPNYLEENIYRLFRL